MARAHSVWVVLVNGKPHKAYTVKHECRSALEGLQGTGWNILTVWKLPDGQYPLFAPKKMTIKEFMES